MIMVGDWCWRLNICSKLNHDLYNHTSKNGNIIINMLRRLWSRSADLQVMKTNISSPQSGRFALAVAVVSGHLFIIGGNDGKSSVNVVEKFNPVKNKSELVTPMKRPREWMAVAVTWTVEIQQTRVLWADFQTFRDCKIFQSAQISLLVVWSCWILFRWFEFARYR